MFDLIVALVILVSAVIGFARGATRELVSVVAFVLAVIISVIALRLSVPLTIKVIHTEWIAKAVALLIVGVAAWIILRIIGGSLTRHVRHTKTLGAVDRAIGVGFGLVRALVILGVFNLVFHAATPPERTPAWVTDAKLYPLTLLAAKGLQTLAPKGFAIADKVAPAIGDAISGSDDSARDNEPERGYDAATRKSAQDLVEKSR